MHIKMLLPTCDESRRLVRVRAGPRPRVGLGVPAAQPPAAPGTGPPFRYACSSSLSPAAAPKSPSLSPLPLVLTLPPPSSALSCACVLGRRAKQPFYQNPPRYPHAHHCCLPRPSARSPGGLGGGRRVRLHQARLPEEPLLRHQHRPRGHPAARGAGVCDAAGQGLELRRERDCVGVRVGCSCKVTVDGNGRRFRGLGRVCEGCVPPCPRALPAPATFCRLHADLNLHCCFGECECDKHTGVHLHLPLQGGPRGHGSQRHGQRRRGRRRGGRRRRQAQGPVQAEGVYRSRFGVQQDRAAF